MNIQSILKRIGGSYKNTISHETMGQKCSVFKEDLVIQLAKICNMRRNIVNFYYICPRILLSRTFLSFYILCYKITDWNFEMSLKNRLHQEVYAEREKVYFESSMMLMLPFLGELSAVSLFT